MAMQKAYQRINWENLPSEKTPVDEINLNKMDKGIDDLDDRIVALDNQVSSGNGQIFSTEAVECGEWVDGKPIYSKTYIQDSLSETSVTFDINELSYKRHLSVSGSALTTDTNKIVNIPYSKGDKFIDVDVNLDKQVLLTTDSTNYKNIYINTLYIGKRKLKNPVRWADGTDEELLAMIEAHRDEDINIYDYWNVGDERVVHLNAVDADGVLEAHAEQDAIFVLLHKNGTQFSDGSGECSFVVGLKEPLKEPGFLTNTDSGTEYTRPMWYIYSLRKPWLQNVFPRMLPDNFRKMFRPFQNTMGDGDVNYVLRYHAYSELFTLPSYMELYDKNQFVIAENRDGYINYGTTIDGNGAHWANDGFLFEYYKNNGAAKGMTYHTRSHQRYSFVLPVDSNGNRMRGYFSGTKFGIAPHGCI